MQNRGALINKVKLGQGLYVCIMHEGVNYEE